MSMGTQAGDGANVSTGEPVLGEISLTSLPSGRVPFGVTRLL